MGLFTQDILGFNVEFYGVEAYTNSGSEESPIRAYVGEERWREAVDLTRDPVALLPPLAASRLLSMMRREPRYVEPLMAAIGACSDALLEADPAGAAAFRVREVVETDTARLEESIALGLKGALPMAELNGSLPLVVAGREDAERTTSVRLRAPRRGGIAWAEFKFGIRGSNPLTTAGSLFAVIEHVARTMDYPTITQPAAAGLRVLATLWHGCGSPIDVPVRMSKAFDGVISQTVVADDPLELADLAADLSPER